MTDRPRSKLNPSAQPWGRAVEGELDLLRSDLAAAQQTIRSQGRFISAGKGNGYADGSIYRPNGIVVPDTEQDFTMFSAADIEDDESQYGSVNVQPGYVAMRTQNNVNGVITDLSSGIARLGPTTFEVGWNVLDPHDFVAEGGEDTPITMHQGFFYGWRASDADYSSNMRGLVIGNGLISFREFTDAHNYVGTDMALGEWLQGSLNVDTNGVAHPTLTLFGQHVLQADGTGLNASVPDASHTQKGAVRLATTDEAATGTDDSTAVTPKQLAAAVATVDTGGGGTGDGKNLASYWRGEWVAP